MILRITGLALAFAVWGCDGACVRNSDCPGMLVCMEGMCAMPIVEMDADIPDGEPGDGGVDDAETDAEMDAETDAEMDAEMDAGMDAGMDDAGDADMSDADMSDADMSDADMSDAADGGVDGTSDAG